MPTNGILEKVEKLVEGEIMALAKEPPDKYPFTDLGNAERLKAAYGDILRYNHAEGHWLIWNGTIWEKDNDKEIFNLVQLQARELYKQAATIEDKKFKEITQKWARKSESYGSIRSTARIARGLRGIASNGKGWDDKPWLFACKNGVIDLKTGELRAGDPKDLMTMRSSIEYKQQEISEWKKFLNDIADGNEELIYYIKKCVGYMLVGIAPEKAIFMCYGWTGNNGKSTFIDILKYIMGDYWQEAADKVFEFHKNETQTNDLVKLRNKRLVTYEETGDAMLFNEKNAKRLSGYQTTINARGLHKESITFNPVCKIWMSFNQKPKIRDQSPAFWKRINMIHFKKTFDPSKNQDIGERLKKETSGILLWAIEGCLDWQREGIKDKPACVIEATKEYENASYPLQDWIEECCIEGVNEKGDQKNAYLSYKKWFAEQGDSKYVMGVKAFSTLIDTRYQRKKSHGTRMIYGLSIKEIPWV